MVVTCDVQGRMFSIRKQISMCHPFAFKTKQVVKGSL